jgi:hypothetical protein
LICCLIMCRPAVYQRLYELQTHKVITNYPFSQITANNKEGGAAIFSPGTLLFS